MAELRVWLGKSGHFKAECAQLIKILRSMESSGVSLALQTQQIDGFHWILGDEAPDNSPDVEPGFITLFTSGTTGTPKRVRRNWLKAMETKKGSGSPNDSWLLTFSPTRWAGLSVIGHALKHGSTLVIPDELTFEAIVRKIPECTHLALTPSLFRKLQLSGLPLYAPNLQQVTFGGEWATQSILDTAQHIWPNARISHIYAAAEFGDLVAASDGREGYPRLPGTVSETGELMINGRPTGDLWFLKNNRWYFRGRVSDIANVGGAKVNLQEVQLLVLNQAGVDECHVYTEQSPLLGQLVCAEYVGSIEPSDLTGVLRGLLPKFAVPRLTRVSSIGLSDSGKVGRR